MDVKPKISKPCGLFYLKLIHIQHIESCSSSTAQRRIREVFDLLPRERPTRHAKVTLQEYADHFELPVLDIIKIINEKFYLNITP